ncbi:DUF748 domain-containing protein [Congregibacter brevis]|uniref:DUF748 domain-containing protein n=1 Tax=Congregibacter brevis TaxID=3081201 RepID=A0ABZ0I9G4_9GAMM|nr:DUF748 domain-containing protein [Congregibacter sp. IMCC45268]
MPSVLRILFRWCLRGYLFYLFLSLFVALPALNIMVPRLTHDALNRELQSEILLFNPFSLTLEARGVSIVEPSGHTPLGFESLEVNLSLESLWEPGIVLDKFSVEQLDIHVLRHAAGEFHFADLIDGSEETESEEPTEAPGITIHDLLIEAHTIRFTDETKPGPYTTVQRDFRVRTQNLTTVPERQSDGDLVLTGDGGGEIRWNGEMAVAAGNSRGRVILEGIDLTPAWRYEADTLPFVVNSARLSAAFNYSVDWDGDLKATLSDSEIRLKRTDLRPADADSIPNTSVMLEEVAVTGIAMDLAKQLVDVNAVTIDGLKISGYDEGGDPSLLAMFGIKPEQADVSSPKTAAETADSNETADGAPWTISLSTFDLQNSEVAWRTSYLAPEVMRLSPLSVAVQEVAWPATMESPYQLSLAINDNTMIKVAGLLNIESGSGSAKAEVAHWPLPWLNPLVNEQARAHIGRGDFSLQSTVSLNAFAPDKIEAALQIKDYSTVLDETGEEAFTFDMLSLDGIAADVPGQSLVIDSFTLQRPSGSLHIREDGVINVNGIVRGGPQDDEGLNEEVEVDSDAEDAAWRVQLSKLSLREGRLDFADASLPLPFKTLIDSVEADIKDIDTASEKPLNMEFKGSVDGYAPVVILGSGKPFADRRDAELRFTFRGMDIATMSPYSGTYAGYTLDSGTLSLDLRYALDGQTLDGDNRIVISQMELGEPVESELAIDAPLKLGIALLTDSKGIIDLSVPISGNVDSPDFSLGPIIGRAITNIIVKAVTAPFSLLAGLVGSDDDLENIAFTPGSSALETEAQRSLEALGTALLERPQLNLRIAGGTDPIADSAALKEKLLREELGAQGINAAMIDGQSEAFINELTSRYEALSLTNRSEDDDSEDIPVEPATMWQTLIDQRTLPKVALQDLATERAAIAKRELVTIGGVDPARIAISFDAELAASGVQMIVDS